MIVMAWAYSYTFGSIQAHHTSRHYLQGIELHHRLLQHASVKHFNINLTTAQFNSGKMLASHQNVQQHQARGEMRWQIIGCSASASLIAAAASVLPCSESASLSVWTFENISPNPSMTSKVRIYSDIVAEWGRRPPHFFCWSPIPALR